MECENTRRKPYPQSCGHPVASTPTREDVLYCGSYVFKADAKRCTRGDACRGHEKQVLLTVQARVSSTQNGGTGLVNMTGEGLEQAFDL